MDDARLACAIKDLQNVPLSTELSESLKTQKGKTKVIISQLDEETKNPDLPLLDKKEATERAEKAMKPILNELKEAIRRIRVASWHLKVVDTLGQIYATAHVELRPLA